MNQWKLYASIGIIGLTSALGIAHAASEADMVSIPKGEFTMGSNHHSDESLHQVVLDAYKIDKYEASNARFKVFMKATGNGAPAYWDDPRLNKPNHPVVGVSWNDATNFCKWDGKRLPTEAEWERAAKGPGGDTHYPWGHSLDSKKANYGQQVGSTTPVDSYPQGVSGFGVYNMSGNVFEWVQDWYDPKYFKISVAFNPPGPEKGYNFANQGAVKALRGGSWLAPETSLHTSHRFWNQPDNNSYGVGLGFRCAQSIPTSSSNTPLMAAASSPSAEGRNYSENDGDTQQSGNDAFIQALIAMGAEKDGDALVSIEKALLLEPGNPEYLATRKLLTNTKTKKKK